MWKLGGLFILALVSAAYSQNVTFECDYRDYGSLYVCELQNITLLDPSLNVIFIGTHVDNKTDADVNFVGITSSNTPFIIPQLFTTFPNIIELDIVYSNLQSMIIPPEIQLEELVVFGNNISRIESTWLRNQTRLRQFYASSNEIAEIDEDAFADLTSLDSLILSNNRIRELRPRLFANMSIVIQIYVDANLLTTIEEGTFSQNPVLTYLFLDYNQINNIHPRALTPLRENLYYISLNGNECVSRSFSVYNEGHMEWIVLNTMLQPCFNNFVGSDPDDVKTVSLQFTGSLVVFDSFGNMIGRF